MIMAGIDLCAVSLAAIPAFFYRSSPHYHVFIRLINYVFTEILNKKNTIHGFQMFRRFFYFLATVVIYLRLFIFCAYCRMFKVIARIAVLATLADALQVGKTCDVRFFKNGFPSNYYKYFMTLLIMFFVFVSWDVWLPHRFLDPHLSQRYSHKHFLLSVAAHFFLIRFEPWYWI